MSIFQGENCVANGDYLSTSEIIDLIYPVGSIYMSLNETSPQVLFGGTWVKIEGRTLIGAGSATDTRNETKTFELGSTSGEYNHQLTIPELAKHYHTLPVAVMTINYPNGKLYEQDGHHSQMQTTPISTDTEGNNVAHNNLPPYLVVNIWKRTS